MKKNSITCSGQTISYTVKRSARRSFGIMIKPDLSVRVSAPERSSLSEIEKVVEGKSAWILKKISFYSGLASANPPLTYTDGENHLYMGQFYILKVAGNASKGGADLRGRSIFVTLRGRPDSEAVMKQLYKWYRERALEVFDAALNQCLTLFKNPGIQKPELKVVRMKARWGSCNPRKRIVVLNTELIRAPAECLEYVAVHELCHLKHNGHGRAFYSLLEEVMPDWKQRRTVLKGYLL